MTLLVAKDKFGTCTDFWVAVTGGEIREEVLSVLPPPLKLLPSVCIQEMA